MSKAERKNETMNRKRERERARARARECQSLVELSKNKRYKVRNGMKKIGESDAVVAFAMALALALAIVAAQRKSTGAGEL